MAGELIGRRVTSLERRGKRIVFTLDNHCRFYVHLGMTGQLMVARTAGPAEAAAQPRPTHTHLELEFGRQEPEPDPKSEPVPEPVPVPTPVSGASANGSRDGHDAGNTAPGRTITVRFRDPRRFGGVWWLGRERSHDQGMGPEPLTLRPSQLAGRLARTSRPVKVALLDQSLIAGLGNIYVDESLFRAGIHPLTPAKGLTGQQVARLSRAIKFTLRRAIRHRGSTLRDYRDADGAAGSFQGLHAVYDRADQPCRHCRTPIERIVLGGRSTHFCPACQKSGVARRIGFRSSSTPTSEPTSMTRWPWLISCGTQAANCWASPPTTGT